MGFSWILWRYKFDTLYEDLSYRLCKKNTREASDLFNKQLTVRYFIVRGMFSVGLMCGYWRLHMTPIFKTGFVHIGLCKTVGKKKVFFHFLSFSLSLLPTFSTKYVCRQSSHDMAGDWSVSESTDKCFFLFSFLPTLKLQFRPLFTYFGVKQTTTVIHWSKLTQNNLHRWKEQSFFFQFLPEVWLSVHWARHNIFAKIASELLAVNCSGCFGPFWP